MDSLYIPCYQVHVTLKIVTEDGPRKMLNRAPCPKEHDAQIMTDYAIEAQYLSPRYGWPF